MDPNDIRHDFAWHPPADLETAMAHERVRRWCCTLMLNLNEELPDGREKSLAKTHLEEVMFWANAAITRRTE